MVEVSGVAQWQAWRERLLPPVEQVRPGLWSVPVPMPYTSLRYVLAYALEIPDGIALVDPGWSSDEAWAALGDGLARTGHSVADVRLVLVTHIHVDHHGLAGRVREASGAPVLLHEREARTLPNRHGDAEAHVARERRWLRRLGAPADEVADVARILIDGLPLAELVEPDRLVEHGELLPLPGWELRALWTPGHTPGHLCFHDARRRLLLSGDHVLPRISPNVSVHPLLPSNALAEFLGTFDELSTLDVDEVLPAHEYRFRGLPDRLAALRAHHEARLDELLQRLAERPGSTVWELASRLTWSRSWEETHGALRRAAATETLAHLLLLESRGLAARTGEVPRWRAVSSRSAPGRPAR
jgi:glyoxylase-like metal-dependent hydrolase (beta-lactamase superfamily II)